MGLHGAIYDGWGNKELFERFVRETADFLR